MRFWFAAWLGLLHLSTPASAQDSPLVGVWRFSGSGYASELVIQPNGQFSKLDRNAQGSETMISGPISVYGDPPMLRLNIQDWAPRQWCGPLGCTPIQMIAAEVYQFQFRGQSVLVLRDQNAEYPYRRVR